MLNGHSDNKMQCIAKMNYDTNTFVLCADGYRPRCAETRDNHVTNYK